MKKIIALFLLFTVIFTGCGSNQNDTASGNSNAGSSTPRITSYNVCYTKLLRNDEENADEGLTFKV